MSLIIMDLEMNVVKREAVEIIQIGAVRLDEASLSITDEFMTYVFPEYFPVSARATKITGILQEDVKSAPLLAEALKQFDAWAGRDYKTMYSWSMCDIEQIQRECSLKGIDQTDLAYMYGHWGDFQKEFCDLIGYERQLKLQAALGALDLVAEGKAHAALDDARNTAFLYEAAHNPKKQHLIDTIRDILIPSTCTTSLGDILKRKL